MVLVYIAVGGAVGALARYGLATWVQAAIGGRFPWGTFTVNIAGSFLLGLLFRLLEGTAAPAGIRGLLTVGLLGAFTTFSTFSLETVILIQRGHWSQAAAYAAGSVAFGLAGAGAGIALGGLALRSAA